MPEGLATAREYEYESRRWKNKTRKAKKINQTASTTYISFSKYVMQDVYKLPQWLCWVLVLRTQEVSKICHKLVLTSVIDAV